MAEIEGEVDERFGAVAEALARNLDEGLDVGASVAVVLDGQPVVDIWGGYKDLAGTEAWAADTIVNVFSTTKTMTALCALILADRDELDLHAPMTRYWPEFAAAGKELIEVRHLLGHTAGLSGWDEPLAVEDLADWERCTSLLAAQAPWWEPGARSGYHAVAARHDHLRLVHHQDHDRAVRAHPGRPRRPGPGRAGSPVLARVRRRGQVDDRPGGHGVPELGEVGADLPGGGSVAECVRYTDGRRDGEGEQGGRPARPRRAG